LVCIQVIAVAESVCGGSKLPVLWLVGLAFPDLDCDNHPLQFCQWTTLGEVGRATHETEMGQCSQYCFQLADSLCL